MALVDKRRLDDYIYYITSLLKQEDFYDTYLNSIKTGKNKYEMSQRFQKKKFDLDWVEEIEDAITSLDTIVRNPRKFIVIEEDIVDVSLARNISTESVKHLAQHTNLIASINEEGMVVPSKILNTSKEESFEIYENRFIYTLILKLHQFINKRFDVIKKAHITSDSFQVKISSEYNIGKQKVSYSMETRMNMPLDEMLKADTTQLTDFERIARLASIVNGFLGSPFAKTMVSCALVRPPIIRTNVILKNPDFKKALVLWQFIDSYQQNGFEIKSVDSTDALTLANQEKFNNLIYLNDILIESIVRQSTSDENLESSEEEKKKKEKNKENEYITKNIDDFVPDDFPELKLSLFETKRVFTKLPEIAEITREEERKVTRAIDRVLLQYKINKTKKDSEQRANLIRKLVEEEDKAKLAALKASKEAEKKAERERVRAEKEAKKQERLNKKLAKERELREAKEREERIRREEEEAMLARLEAEKEAAEERILEENRRLNAIYEAEKARVELERKKLKEQLERERQMSFLEPVENNAMLKLRKKEQARIMQMRSAQELALREMITAHYQEMENMQKMAILDMESIADMCDFDIFASDNTGESADDIVIGDTPTAAEMEAVDISIPDVPEADLSLTSKDENGDYLYARKAGLIHDDESDKEEVDPTLDRSALTISTETFAPSEEREVADDDYDEDLVFRGFDEPLDATAKYKPKSSKVDYANHSVEGKLVRPSKILEGASPKVSILDDEWDFDGVEDLAEKREKKEEEIREEERKKILSETKIFSKNTPSSGITLGTYVPKPRNTISVTNENLDEVLSDKSIVGNDSEDDKKKKKSLFGRKKKND